MDFSKSGANITRGYNDEPANYCRRKVKEVAGAREDRLHRTQEDRRIFRKLMEKSGLLVSSGALPLLVVPVVSERKAHPQGRPAAGGRHRTLNIDVK